MEATMLLLLLMFTCTSSQDLAISPARFSIELLHFTSLQTENHVVISPFGVWTLMTGIALGAVGNTETEIRRAFFLPANNIDIMKNYKGLARSVLTSNSTEVSLVSKNFVFIDSKLKIQSEYKNLLQDHFEASVKMLDFQDPSAARTANNYIKNSNPKLSNVLIEEDFLNSKMILTNVISFKGLWKFPFKKNDTSLENFFDESGNVIGKVNMMYQRAQVPFSNIKALKGFALELPYGQDGKYSMLLLLPYARTAVKDMYKNLAKVELKDIFYKLDQDVEEFGAENIDVKLPRFKITSNVVLNKPLNDMGVYDVFDSLRADFRRLTKEKLFVSAIVHKADIEVTESGTTADASTSANFADRISTPTFIASRPFVYFIVDKPTKTVIFNGIYSKPTVY